MRRALPILVTAAMLLALPAAGRSAARTPPAPEAWATVNVCDTLAHPNEIGIRGGMPGLARRTRMYMRFRVQYRTSAGRWQLVEQGADSEWRRVGTGRRGEYDSGWTFEFKPPAAGGAHVLRGVVSFQWRRRHRVVQRDRRFTQEGHPGTAGADPADFSARLCAIA
jgi:hypothetical protein